MRRNVRAVQPGVQGTKVWERDHAVADSASSKTQRRGSTVR